LPENRLGIFLSILSAGGSSGNRAFCNDKEEPKFCIEEKKFSIKPNNNGLKCCFKLSKPSKFLSLLWPIAAKCPESKSLTVFLMPHLYKNKLIKVNFHNHSFNKGNLIVF
jgi:hypothetical protein